MSLKVGDTFFDTHGRPATVVERNPKENHLVVEREGERFEAARKKGFINGLSIAQREQYDEILKEIREEEEEPEGQVKLLQEKIDELSNDPRNHVVTRYLRSQLGHVLNSEKINPRVYKVDLDNIRA